MEHVNFQTGRKMKHIIILFSLITYSYAHFPDISDLVVLVVIIINIFILLFAILITWRILPLKKNASKNVLLGYISISLIAIIILTIDMIVTFPLFIKMHIIPGFIYVILTYFLYWIYKRKQREIQ